MTYHIPIVDSAFQVADIADLTAAKSLRSLWAPDTVESLRSLRSAEVDHLLICSEAIYRLPTLRPNV